MYGACYCLFLTSSPHTSPFSLPDPIPQLAIRPPASFNEFSNDKLITVVYSHLLCLSTSWFWGGRLALCRSTVPPHWGGLVPGWLSHVGHQETVRETWQSHQYPLWQNAGFTVTSDLSHSTLQQGRPLREQQEVAAAVIQRCYKKYKQVGTTRALCVLNEVTSDKCFCSSVVSE